jgi:hypothetical protein
MGDKKNWQLSHQRCNETVEPYTLAHICMSSSSVLSRDTIGAMANCLQGAHYYGLQH